MHASVELSSGTHNQQHMIWSKLVNHCFLYYCCTRCKILLQLSLSDQVHTLCPVPFIASFIVVPPSPPSLHGVVSL